MRLIFATSLCVCVATGDSRNRSRGWEVTTDPFALVIDSKHPKKMRLASKANKTADLFSNWNQARVGFTFHRSRRVDKTQTPYCVRFIKMRHFAQPCDFD
jgi:hypothetical protein